MITREYFGCRVAQRGKGNSVEFVVFMAHARDIMQWAGTRKVGEHEKGTQRILKPARVRQIKRFLQADLQNTLPTSVVIAFPAQTAIFRSLQQKLAYHLSEVNSTNQIGSKMEWGTLYFEVEEEQLSHEPLALIVDGQHRLHGMAQYEEEELPVLVVALIDASLEEQAFQFVVINNKSSKVPTDNVKAIIASQLDETELQRRLLKAGVRYGQISETLKYINDYITSPFRNLLDWPLTPENRRLVSLTAVEAGLKTLRKQIPVLENEPQMVRDIFLAIWRVVRWQYRELWTTNKKFMSKVNINALNQYLTQKLAFAWEGDLIDIYDLEQVSAQTKSTLSVIPARFWEIDWACKLQDNAMVREMIRNDLRTIAQNRKNSRKQWYSGLVLIKAVDHAS